MHKTKYKRITNDEREEISRFLAAGKSQADIAMALDRHPTTISREIKRNYGKSGYPAFSAGKRSLKTAASRRKRKFRLKRVTARRNCVIKKTEAAMVTKDDI